MLKILRFYLEIYLKDKSVHMGQCSNLKSTLCIIVSILPVGRSSTLPSSVQACMMDTSTEFVVNVEFEFDSFSSSISASWQFHDSFNSIPSALNKEVFCINHFVAARTLFGRILSNAIECLKLVLRLNFKGIVSFSLKSRGNFLTVEVTSAGTFTTFPVILIWPPRGFSRNCINGILGAMSLSSRGNVQFRRF